MKAILVFSFFFTISSSLTPSLAQNREKNYYSRRYDNLDVNLIFSSSRLLNNYVDCLLDKKPCPPEGKDLKSKISDDEKEIKQRVMMMIICIKVSFQTKETKIVSEL